MTIINYRKPSHFDSFEHQYTVSRRFNIPKYKLLKIGQVISVLRNLVCYVILLMRSLIIKRIKIITYGKSLRSSTLSLTSSSDWSVSCHSTWHPSSFFFNASFEEAEIIFCLIGDDCGDQTMKVNLKIIRLLAVQVTTKVKRGKIRS